MHKYSTRETEKEEVKKLDEEDLEIIENVSVSDEDTSHIKEESNESNVIEEYSSSCEAQSDSENEEDYFGDDNVFVSSSSDKEAWEDSESEEEVLRNNYKNDANWINTKKFKKTEIPSFSDFRINFVPGIFKSNFNIRFIKHKKNHMCLVDTMNIIYLLEDLKLVYSLKVDRFNISDIEYYNNKIFICNNKYNKLKVLQNTNNMYKITNIEKVFTKNISKLRSFDNYFYVLGENTLLLDEDLEIIQEVHSKLIDLTYFNNSIFGLSISGDVLQYTREMKLINKIIYKDKFSLRRLVGLTDYLVIISTCGLIFIDKNLKYIKEKKENKNTVVGITEDSGYFIYFTDNKKGLKILDQKLKYISKKNNVGTCRDFINTEEGVIICSYREIHLLKIIKK
jgi:hypothetical protein